MKRTLGILSLTLVLALAAVAQTANPAPAKAEKLSKTQLLSLIATAKTPAEHERIAQYYEARAQDYLAQSREHEQMAAQYRKNPLISSSKWATGTVQHCEYIAQSLKDDATKMQELAQLHRQMAASAEMK